MTVYGSEYSLSNFRIVNTCTFEVCNKLSYKDIITGTRLYIGVVLYMVS